MRNPFARQFRGFRIEAGTDSAKNGKIDVSCTTNKGQGIIIYENGNSDFVVNATSKEVLGHNIEDDKTPAKIIDAINGDIHLRAKNGTIILEAANIRIVGVDGEGGEITIQGSKIVSIEGPTITAQASGDATIAAAKEAHLTGTAAANLNSSGKNTSNSGVDTDSSSIMGQILAGIKKFKDFWNSICAI